jgi:hypothetical protein
MKELNRMCSIAKIVFNDNLITFALENDVNSKYYITNIIVKENNVEQVRKFITDCDELISKPVTFKIYTNNEMKQTNFKKILINNN